MIRLALLASAVLLPLAAHAQNPCIFIPGGCPPQNVFQTHMIPAAAAILLRVAGGLSVIFIVWACIQMVTAYGDTGKIATARYSILYSLIGMLLAILSQLIVAFVVTEPSFRVIGTANTDIAIMASILRLMIRAFNVILGIMVVLAGIKMVIAGGALDEYNKGKTILTWSLIAAVAVNVAHALVNAVVTHFL